MKRHQLSAMIVCMAWALSSCGGSDSAGSNPAGGSMTYTYHANDTVESVGHIQNGLRQGPWKWFYDNQQLHTEVNFVNGTFDENAAWIIYNRDSSIRADHSDGPHVFDKPWP